MTRSIYPRHSSAFSGVMSHAPCPSPGKTTQPDSASDRDKIIARLYEFTHHNESDPKMHLHRHYLVLPVEFDTIELEISRSGCYELSDRPFEFALLGSTKITENGRWFRLFVGSDDVYINCAMNSTDIVHNGEKCDYREIETWSPPAASLEELRVITNTLQTIDHLREQIPEKMRSYLKFDDDNIIKNIQEMLVTEVPKLLCPNLAQ